MQKLDMEKKDLYEAVKQLVESDIPHVHLPQQKLFTLFTIAFQYLLFKSTKKPGVYLIRVEDSLLAEKLARKTKDKLGRQMFQKLLLPRKVKYGESTFLLDFFHIGSWSYINNIPKDRIQAALVVKNTIDNPMFAMMGSEEDEEENMEDMQKIPPQYYISSLIDFIPHTISIAFNIEIENTEKVKFPFIKSETQNVLEGVKIANNINIEE